MLRAKLMMALLALVVLGLGLMAMIVMGGRFARRVARTPLPPSRIHDDRWYAKPLNASETDQADADEPASDGTSGSDERPDADGPADSDGSRG
jgi:hypothetical protein